MEPVRARLIIEIMGRPPEHISRALQEIVDKMDNEKGASIKSSTVHKPVAVKDSKGMFTSFAEIEIEFDSIPTCFWMCFAYMPSNIEIMHPESFKVSNADLNSLIGNIVERLHKYDAIAKTLIAQRDALAKRIEERSSLVEGKSIFIKEGLKPEKNVKKKAKKKRKKSGS